MSIFFLRDVLLKVVNIPGKRVVFSFLLQGDLIILLLVLILVMEVIRWRRLVRHG